ncbi:Arabinanase/levansucrase/invertase [Glarea lozoyensis ATCC 20868]|uniref:beta-fructofuranosidase n=1 Tax=Glarea lozoyensis (strain ATCC 20868 / MF5171) TaxID=1116229 RepID=S3DQE0_GLAL2|nr:Arabinanase/levansucrase/invertase [Glarea lozoyensis ATCC 20868]EPE34246.1 Arabinanase/levansucrase/invertase [Glarea lozoyensis ATCC 20868]
MGFFCKQSVLLNFIFSLSALQTCVSGSVIARAADCHANSYKGPLNPSFENGIKDWKVISGNAFGDNSASSETSYWGGPFNKIGNSFLWGLLQSGEAAVGELHSSTFRASSFMSFLIGGGWGPEDLYVGLVSESDGKILYRQTATNDEAMIRIVWDTSAYAGQNVYVSVVDNSTATSWGHINLDDIRTGCDALIGEKGNHFNVLGQANQPIRSQSTLKPDQLFASDPIRPQFHYTPYQGWINDPAGLIEWKGKHQLFSQFNPVAPLWGPMHMAHADSSDAVHWRELPVAMYPPYVQDPLDTSGRFTGSAVLDNSTGGIHFIFTDATDVSRHPGKLPEVQSSALSTDGINFDFYSGNPIIAAPPPRSGNGWRDPKVFHDTTDNTWKMVVGSGEGATGNVQLYVATDEKLLSWKYIGVLTEGTGSTGGMWECPNFFPIGDKWVLFYGGNSLGFWEVGTYDGTKFTSEKVGLLDAGPDSYAMQWYKDSAGRNLAIAWMGNWPTSKWPSRVNGWAGTQSITRELFIRADGGLGSKPIKEVSSLANGPAKALGAKNVHGTISVGSTNTARLQVTVDLATSNAPGFTIFMHKSNVEQVTLYYSVKNQTLTLDTTNAGYGQAGTWNAVVAKSPDNKLSLDIFIDRSSVEVFAGDGTAMTATVFPRYQESTAVNIESVGGKTVFDSITLTPFGSTWS